MFGFYIAKSPGNRETTWRDPIGTYEWVIQVLVGHSYKLIDCHLLDHGCRIISFKYGLGLIYAATVRNNSFILTWIHRFMIISKRLKFLAPVSTHYGPAIAHIDHVYVLVDSHYHKCTGPSPIYRSHLLFGLRELLLVLIVKHR